jgi:heme exporter protein A
MKGLNPCAAGIGELLERVGLGARGRDRVGDYSSGMRQRLKWAFALLGDPAALLLDEPGVTLDAEGFATAAALVDRARARGRLIVLATNDTRELELGDERLSLG